MEQNRRQDMGDNEIQKECCRSGSHDNVMLPIHDVHNREGVAFTLEASVMFPGAGETAALSPAPPAIAKRSAAFALHRCFL